MASLKAPRGSMRQIEIKKGPEEPEEPEVEGDGEVVLDMDEEEEETDAEMEIKEKKRGTKEKKSKKLKESDKLNISDEIITGDFCTCGCDPKGIATILAVVLFICGLILAFVVCSSAVQASYYEDTNYIMEYQIGFTAVGAIIGGCIIQMIIYGFEILAARSCVQDTYNWCNDVIIKINAIFNKNPDKRKILTSSSIKETYRFTIYSLPEHFSPWHFWLKILFTSGVVTVLSGVCLSLKYPLISLVLMFVGTITSFMVIFVYKQIVDEYSTQLRDNYTMFKSLADRLGCDLSSTDTLSNHNKKIKMDRTSQVAVCKYILLNSSI